MARPVKTQKHSAVLFNISLGHEFDSDDTKNTTEGLPMKATAVESLRLLPPE